MAKSEQPALPQRIGAQTSEGGKSQIWAGVSSPQTLIFLLRHISPYLHRPPVLPIAPRRDFNIIGLTKQDV